MALFCMPARQASPEIATSGRLFKQEGSNEQFQGFGHWSNRPDGESYGPADRERGQRGPDKG